MDIDRRKLKDNEETPVFDNLEKEFRVKTEAFVALKSHATRQKDYVTRLEEDIESTRDAEKKLRQPMADLKAEVDLGRRQCLELMQTQQTEMEELEKDIYLLGCQLQTVMEENARFQNGIEALNVEESDLEKEAESNTRFVSIVCTLCLCVPIVFIYPMDRK